MYGYPSRVGCMPAEGMHAGANAMPQCDFGEIELVLSMMTNISMTVMFIVPGWSTHESYVQRAHAIEYNSDCL